MNKTFKNKYRAESIRLKNWNYGRSGKYFITICTNDRVCYFGQVESNKMKLSEIGIIAEKIWSEIPKHFDNIKLDQYIIMPNHVHGILEIIDGERDAINRVSSITEINRVSIKKDKGGITGFKNPMFYKNISRVIRWYKGRVTFDSRKIQEEFSWQSRFYDSIIWNDRYLKNIRRYIINNPKKWTENNLKCI